MGCLCSSWNLLLANTQGLVDFLSSDLRSIEIFSQTTLCQAGTNRGVGQAVPVATRRGGGHRHHLLPPLHLLQRHPRLEPLLSRRLLPGGSSTCTRQEVPNFSLQSPLPWSTCNNWWNSARCHSQVFTNTCYWRVDQHIGEPTKDIRESVEKFVLTASRGN